MRIGPNTYVMILLFLRSCPSSPSASSSFVLLPFASSYFVLSVSIARLSGGGSSVADDDADDYNAASPAAFVRLDFPPVILLPSLFCSALSFY